MMCCRQRCFSTAAAAVLALQSFATVCTLRFLLKRWQPSRQGNDWQARLTVTYPSHRATNFLPGSGCTQGGAARVWCFWVGPQNPTVNTGRIKSSCRSLNGPCHTCNCHPFCFEAFACASSPKDEGEICPYCGACCCPLGASVPRKGKQTQASALKIGPSHRTHTYQVVLHFLHGSVKSASSMGRWKWR